MTLVVTSTLYKFIIYQVTDFIVLQNQKVLLDIQLLKNEWRLCTSNPTSLRCLEVIEQENWITTINQ